MELLEQDLFGGRRYTNAEYDLTLEDRKNLFVSDELQHFLVYEFTVQLWQEIAVAEHELIEGLLVLQVGFVRGDVRLLQDLLL